jgi:hypothetical protein
MNEHAMFGPFQTITAFVMRAELLPPCVVISTFNESAKSLTYHGSSPNELTYL